MTESLSRRCQNRSTGVCPRGAQVLRTLGISRKPDSSTKTRWAPSRAAFFYPGPLAALPLGDPFFVALQGSGLGLLVAPLELVHQPAHMVAMVLDAERPLDHFRNAGSGPQFSAVPVGHRALQQDAEQPPLLARGQLGRPARRRADLEPLWAPTPEGVTPAHDRTRGAPEPARDRIERQTALHQLEGTTSAIFQDFRRTLEPHDGRPPVEVSIIIALFTQ